MNKWAAMGKIYYSGNYKNKKNMLRQKLHTKQYLLNKLRKLKLSKLRLTLKLLQKQELLLLGLL